MVVIAGVSRSHMSVSQTSATSSESSALLASRNGLRLGLPDSSSPSNSIETLMGRPPLTAFHARQASTKVSSCALVVGCAAPGDPRFAVGLGHELRIERIGVPQMQRVDRLHVVMTIEQRMRAGLALA